MQPETSDDISSSAVVDAEDVRLPLRRGTTSRRRLAPPDIGDWDLPAFDGELERRIGSSVVEGFVAGHHATDVLRELVQNEFDAGGTEMCIKFGAAGLTVTGNGRPIDSKGWSRLRSEERR